MYTALEQPDKEGKNKELVNLAHKRAVYRNGYVAHNANKYEDAGAVFVGKLAVEDGEGATPQPAS